MPISNEACSVALYADDSSESLEAQRALDEAGVLYNCLWPNADDPKDLCPKLFAREGIFTTLELIKWWARQYGSVYQAERS